MTILDTIVRDTKALVARRKSSHPLSYLESYPTFQAPTLSLDEYLRRKSFAIIAEIKKASPSKGVIRQEFEPAALARQYKSGGASVISVLTEPFHFQGSLEYLRSVRSAVDLPLLRKDFIIDPYQLVEARAYGADAVLLIAAVLDRGQLHELHAAANELGISCLVEVYESHELDRIDMDQVSVLGVNNRDLRTFKVDIQHSMRVFRHVPDTVVKISESGLQTASHLAYLRDHGVDGVLIGETFMRAPDPGIALRQLIRETEELERPVRLKRVI